VVLLRKSFLSLFFLFWLLVISFLFIPLTQFQTASNANTNLTNATILGGGYGALGYYHNTGDFLGWVKTSGSYQTFDNTHNYLYIYLYDASLDQTGTFKRNFLNISTNTVKEYHIRCKADISGGDTCNLRLYYSNGTYIQLFSKSGTSFGSFTWYNGTFNPNSQLDCIRFYGHTTTGGCYIRFNLTIERYDGWFPSLWNGTDYTGIPKQIDTNIQFASFAKNCSLVQCHFLTTWGTSYDLNLASDWSYQFRYFGITQMHNTILYRYYYVASNEWGVATVSSLCFLSSMEHPFPQTATLALYSTIDFLGEDTNQFQYYMGNSEEVSLVDFNSYYGSWSKLYATNLSAYFIDNYIQFNCTNNGLKTTFESMQTIDTLDYNALLFECEVSNPLWLVAIFNPSLHMTDNYYYHFNISQINQWFSVIIPFFNFTNYWSYSSLLGELGFWISAGTIKIANIRAAHYYDAHFFIQPLSFVRFANKTDIITSNQIIAFPFIYTSSPLIVSEGVTSVSLTLTIYNSSPFNLFLYDFNSHMWFPIVNVHPFPANYSSLLILPACYNDSMFLLQFTVTSVLTYIASVCYHAFENYNRTYYIANPYRLVNPQNLQNPDALVFYQFTETLAILDYANNTIWRGFVTYGGWAPTVQISIGIPITTLYCINYANYSIVVDVQRGLGVYIQVIVPPSSMIPVRVFSTCYQVTIRNLEMLLLNITSISCNHSRSVVIPYGKPLTFEIPPPFNPILLYVLIGLAIIGVGALLVQNFLQRRKSQKQTKQEKAQARIEKVVENFKKSEV
jgi:hypothetical protein